MRQARRTTHRIPSQAVLLTGAGMATKSAGYLRRAAVALAASLIAGATSAAVITQTQSLHMQYSGSGGSDGISTPLLHAGGDLYTATPPGPGLDRDVMQFTPFNTALGQLQSVRIDYQLGVGAEGRFIASLPGSNNFTTGVTGMATINAGVALGVENVSGSGIGIGGALATASQPFRCFNISVSPVASVCLAPQSDTFPFSTGTASGSGSLTLDGTTLASTGFDQVFTGMAGLGYVPLVMGLNNALGPLSPDPATRFVGPAFTADLTGAMHDPVTAQVRAQGAAISADAMVTLTYEYDPLLMLPIGNGSPPGPGLGAPFLYNFPVFAGQVYNIDPEIAVGYVYETGPGDPNFASVTLPDLGDPSYQLYDLSDSFITDLAPNVTFDFTSVDLSGFSGFKVLGIDESLMLDPTNVTAFVTSLTFVEDGMFTGSQTPILQQISPPPPSGAPEPGGLALVGAGLLSLGLARRLRHKARARVTTR